MVKCDFSRSDINITHLNIETVVNTTALTHKHSGLETKCATFDCRPLCTLDLAVAPEVRQELLRCCKEIEKYVHRHAGVTMKSGNFFFKIDSSNQM